KPTPDTAQRVRICGRKSLGPGLGTDRRSVRSRCDGSDTHNYRVWRGRGRSERKFCISLGGRGTTKRAELAISECLGTTQCEQMKRPRFLMRLISLLLAGLTGLL